MKKLAIFIAALLIFSAGAFADDLPRIAVYVTGDVSDNEKKALGTRMLASLVNSKRYKGIERSKSFLAEIDKEQEKQRSGEIDDSQISKLGKQFGVKFVCIADITNVLGAFQISARIVDVETAEVAFIGESYSALKNVIDLVAVCDQVVKNMFGEEVKPAVKSKAEPNAPKPEPKPEPPKTYTVAAAANPPNGGTVSLSPNYASYHAGTHLTVTATPRAGYTFAGWSERPASESSIITITVEDNLTLTANFQRVPAPEAPTAAQLKLEPKPKPEPKEKPEFRFSAGGGLFFANGSGGGMKWENSGEIVAMPYTTGGAYLFFDAEYAEAFAGFLAGGGKWKSGDANPPRENSLPDMSRTCVSIGAFAKYPVAVSWIVKAFPLLGFEYEASISGKLKSGANETAFDGGDGRPNAGALSAAWFKLGGGADFGLSQNLYLRAEILYGWRTANAYEKDLAKDEEIVSGKKLGPHTANGLTIKAGAGVKF